MKKVFFILMSVLCMSLTACSSDDDNDVQVDDLSKMVGTWVCTSSYDSWVTDNGSGNATDVMKGVTLTVNADGTYSSSSSSFGLKGQWNVQGGTFSAKSSSGRVMSGQVTMNGNTIRLKGSTTDGYSFDYRFARQ